LSVASSDRREWTKTTTDDHGTHAVDVVEHWQDRQDVTVRAPRVELKATQREVWE